MKKTDHLFFGVVSIYIFLHIGISLLCFIFGVDVMTQISSRKAIDPDTCGCQTFISLEGWLHNYGTVGLLYVMVIHMLLISFIFNKEIMIQLCMFLFNLLFIIYFMIWCVIGLFTFKLVCNSMMYLESTMLLWIIIFASIFTQVALFYGYHRVIKS